MFKKQLIIILSFLCIFLTGAGKGGVSKNNSKKDITVKQKKDNNAKNAEQIKTVLLITEAEASQQDMPASGIFEASRSLNDGPIIDVKTPENGKTYQKPMAIDVRFLPREGKAVDFKTLKVEYLKFITIDITKRILPYVSNEGIRLDKADLPAGKHNIRLTIADVTGAFSNQQIGVVIK